jgi:hypothetical protein
MAASLSLRKYTSTNAATQSSAVTGVDLSSADNATNTLGNRQANPINVGEKSYESWLRLLIDTAPANGVTNFKVWGDGTVQTSTSLKYTAGYITGATPVATTSSVANADFTTATAGNKTTWDSTSYSATGSFTKYLVFQLVVDATAGPGNWTQETVNYSYDET